MSQDVTRRWLILADDLTGAADCAIAFARAGMAAAVDWGEAGTHGAVRAIDADSRRLAPQAAAARHRLLIEAHHRGGTGLFKKIDSTLRGHPAAELAETVRVLRGRGDGALAVMAPAFPATGRTTEAGCIRVDGLRLEDTRLGAGEPSYRTADLVAERRRSGRRAQP